MKSPDTVSTFSLNTNPIKSANKETNLEMINIFEPQSNNSFSFIHKDNEKTNINTNEIIPTYNKGEILSFSMIGNYKNRDHNPQSSKKNNSNLSDYSDLKDDFTKIKEENYNKRLSIIKNNRQTILNSKRIQKEKSEEPNLIKEINLSNVEYVNSIYKCGININNDNKDFYNLIINKLNISKNLYSVFPIKEEENCYYKCLSQFLYNKIEYFDSLRKSVSAFCKDNINEINNYQKEVDVGNKIVISTIDYINNMDKNSYLANDVDILISSYIFDLNIAIYKYSNDRSNLEYLYSYIYQDNSSNFPLMILVSEAKNAKNHFNLIYSKSEEKQDMNDKNDEKSKEEIKNENNSEPFDENPFPKYTYGNDIDLYFNIFNFLNNGVKNRRRTWPEYIANLNDKKIKLSKKLDFYRKLGIIKYCRKNKNGEDNKQDGVNIKDKYQVENNKLYLIRYEHKDSSENKFVYKKYNIPYTKEIRPILYKCHDEIGHPSKVGTLEAIKNNNYYWVSMLEDINKYLKYCEICKKKLEKEKLEKNYNTVTEDLKDEKDIISKGNNNFINNIEK